MPLKPKETVEIPAVSLPTWVFETVDGPLSEEAFVLDPEAPETRFLSLKRYRHWSQRFAAGLRDAGLEVGDAVLFLAGNSTAWPVVFMGTVMAGGMLSGQTPLLSLEKLVHQASEISPKFLLADEAGYERAKEVAKSISLPSDHVYVFDDSCIFGGRSPADVKLAPGQRHWAELLKEIQAPFDWTKYTSPEQVAVVCYTSGSTGNPKGILCSHRNVLATAVQYSTHQTVDPMGPEQGRRMVWMTWTPYFQVIGITQYCVIVPKRGVIHYSMSKFNLDQYLKYTAQYRGHIIFVSPSLIIAMLTNPLVKTLDLTCVRKVLVGGAPLRETTVRRFREAMQNKGLEIDEGFGMSETTGVIIHTNPLVRSDVPCQGELMPNVEAKILTPDGKIELGPNEPGELYVKSPSVALGYLNRPEVTSKTFLPDGWLRTGDFGYYDEEHNWYIRDRIQEIIHREDGSYALPTDIESALICIRGVLDAGVTLVDPPPHLQFKVPRAFVVLDKSVQASVEAVGSEFNARAKPAEQLLGGIFEIDHVPRLSSGKVDRVQLRGKPVGGDVQGL